MIAVGAALLIVLAGVLCRTDVYGAFCAVRSKEWKRRKAYCPRFALRCG